MPRPALLAAPLAASLALAAPPVGAFTREQAQAPMTATLVRGDAKGCGADCPEWLALTGRIGFDTPAVLRAALARLGPRKVPVLLDSPGGETTAALDMGRAIRARGLDTAVASTALDECEPGDAACAARRRAGLRSGRVGSAGPERAACASACVLVLAAGVRRDVPATAAVGVHQTMRIVTTRPRMGFWRILSRTVDGRRVELSRTLVITRVLPDRVTKGDAPESLYAAFDRYLAAMGVDPSIVALMRATPPAGIHWMSRDEIAGTRLATDAAEAGALVEREAASQAAAAALHVVAAPAALTMSDGRRWLGTVRWRIDAGSPAAPALVGDWEVPGRRLGGSVALAPGSAADAAFRVDARLRPAAGPAALPILATEAPRLCDLSVCRMPIAGATAFDAPAASFDVKPSWRDDLLANLLSRDWIQFRVRTAEGWGELALTLSGPDGGAIPAWERACCGIAPDGPRPQAPATPLPALPAKLSPFAVPGIAAVAPTASAAAPPPRNLPVRALFAGGPAPDAGDPSPERGTVLWTPLLASAEVAGPPATALLADVALPALGLRIALDVRASPPGVLGRLAVSVHAAADEGARFGTPVTLSVPYGYGERGHVLLLPDRTELLRTPGDALILVDVPATGPIAGAIQLGFTDAARRRLTVAVPFDGAVAGVLQAASRWAPAGGS